MAKNKTIKTTPTQITSITRHELGERSRTYSINGEEVISVDYDNYGWSGMEGVDEVFTKLASITGVKITDTTVYDEED